MHQNTHKKLENYFLRRGTAPSQDPDPVGKGHIPPQTLPLVPIFSAPAAPTELFLRLKTCPSPNPNPGSAPAAVANAAADGAIDGSRQSSAKLRTVDDVGDGPYQMSTSQQQHSGNMLVSNSTPIALVCICSWVGWGVRGFSSLRTVWLRP